MLFPQAVIHKIFLKSAQPLALILALLALFALQTSLRADTNAEATPEDLFKAGATSFQSGDYAGAAKNFEAVLALEPKGDALETILFSLAGTYYSQKNFPKAEEYFNRLLKEFPGGKDETKALVSLSQIQMQTGHKEEAEKSLKKASEGTGNLATQAKLSTAALLAELGKKEEALAMLRPLVTGGVKNATGVQAAMQTIQIDAKLGNIDEALQLLVQLQTANNLVNNPLQLDMLSVQIGDGMLEKGEKQKALRIYAMVRTKDVVASLQKDRIEALQKQIEENKMSIQRNPKDFLDINATNTEIQSTINGLQKGLNDFQNMPDISVPVRIRQAKAYDELDGKWETILIWEGLLDGATPSVREDALFSIASAYVALARPDDAFPALDRYIAEFPSGKYLSQANYLQGALAMEGGDYAKAETIFGTRIEKAGDDQSELASDMQFLLGNAQFAMAADPAKRDKYKEAIANYKTYLSKYPKGKHVEECEYRIPLASFMMGDYGTARDGFKEYAKKYPQGDFAGDVDYRIALCYNAEDPPKYDEVIKLCDEWEKKHGGEVMEAEVLALKGDAYAGKAGLTSGDESAALTAESAAAYLRSVHEGETDELLKYSLFAANTQYQKINRWDQISEMFSDFAEKHPDHPAAVAAVYWVSKAKIKEGKTDEAKQYLAATILKYIDNRSKDAVEQLLTQLAQTCSKRARRPLIALENAAASPTPSATPSPTPAANTNAAVADQQITAPTPTPTPLPPYDADADFAKYLNESNAGASPLAKARLRFARAQLAGFTKRPDRKTELLASIYRDFPADQLSAQLLAECGQIALAKGELDKSEAFYKELMTSFPKSDLREYAYDGMGWICLARNKPQDALNWFNDAIDKVGAESQIAHITYGKGLALLALDKTDEAKKIFEQVAGTKEWRGEVTAQALLSLGDIEEKKGNTVGAIQIYQRVFVAYQRYPDEVITAYFKAADAFIKLNQPEKAAAHLKEMLSKPRLAALPRAEEARKRLETLPAPSLPTSSPSSSPLP
jgi:TolA-binding protein